MEPSREIWRHIAPWWDQQIGEGNEFQRQLIMPASDRLLDLKPGEHVLDACCGNGNYSRRMARSGARVFAFDGAEAFIDQARKRTTSSDGEMEYEVLDATDPAQLATLGENRFDAAVCSMALMDIDPIAPLLHAIHRALKSNGRLVFSVPHPCFNSGNVRMTAELINENGELRQEFGVAVREYVDDAADLSHGIINQPEPHPSFHRSIARLLGECFAADFIVDAIEEPAFADGSSAKNAFSWAKRPKIPPAMVARCRPRVLPLGARA